MPKHNIRVLYVVQSARMYGSQRSLIDILTGLKSSSLTPIVAIREEGLLTKELSDLGVPFQVLPMRNWLNNRDAFQSWRKSFLNTIYANKLARFARSQGIDLIHTNTFIIPTGAMAAKRLEIPHIWHAREHLKPKNGHVFTKSDSDIKQFVDHTTKAVLTPSPANTPWLSQYAPETKIRVVVNGPLDEATKQPFHQKEAIANRPARIAVIGRLGPAKGTEDALKAASLLKQMGIATEWSFVGSGEDEYNERIAELVGEYEIKDVVAFQGYQQNVEPHYRQADIVVMPSHAETFGRVTAEALGYGCPVVASRIPPTLEIIEEGKNGQLFATGDAQDLANSIAVLIANPDLRERLARQGYEDAWQKYTRQRLGKEIATIYDEALS